jgi:hypothetical protein
VQAQGPYLITGHSLGGFLAYELARGLRARGPEVAVLGLADTLTPESSARAWRRHMALRSRLRRQRDRGLRAGTAKLVEVAERELRETLIRLGLVAPAEESGEEWFDYRGADVLGRRYRPLLPPPRQPPLAPPGAQRRPARRRHGRLHPRGRGGRRDSEAPGHLLRRVGRIGTEDPGAHCATQVRLRRWRAQHGGPGRRLRRWKDRNSSQPCRSAGVPPESIPARQGLSRRP